MPLLVVEDDELILMLVLEVLEELGYTDAIGASDAAQALAVLNDPEQPLALMMTDVGLPDMLGTELANLARQQRPQLPILFATGYSDSIAIPEGMHSIGKPFTIDALKHKLGQILGAP